MTTAEKLKQIQALLATIPDVHIHDLRNFVDGNISVNRKGVLKLPLSLPAADIIQNPDNVMDVVEGKWKMVPILMFVGVEE